MIFQLVIGTRVVIRNFSLIKRALQWIGSNFIQFLTKEPVNDAVSGFRAYSRDALLKLNIFHKLYIHSRYFNTS